MNAVVVLGMECGVRDLGTWICQGVIREVEPLWVMSEGSDLTHLWELVKRPSLLQLVLGLKWSRQGVGKERRSWSGGRARTNWDLWGQTGTTEDELRLSVSHYLQDFTCNDAGDLWGNLLSFGRELPASLKEAEDRSSASAGGWSSGRPPRASQVGQGIMIISRDADFPCINMAATSLPPSKSWGEC